MELKLQSDPISLELDTGDGATSPILFYHRGYLSEEGKKMRWFAAQIHEDNKLTIHRITDFKGNITTVKKKLGSFPVTTTLTKTGTMNYVNRMSVNRHSQILQQTAPTRQWVFYQVDFSIPEFVKCLILDVEPDSGSTIDYLTRYGRHLYFRVIDGGGDWYIYYVNLNNHPKYGTVSAVTNAWAVTNDETDICAGENYLYVMESGDLKLYTHGSFDTPTTTYSSVITDTEVDMREIDDDDLLVRVSGTTLYRIEAGTVETLSTALESDTSNYRCGAKGDGIWVEAIDVTRTPNTADAQTDNWYLIPDEAEVNASADTTIKEICTDVGVEDADVDVSLVTDDATVIQGFLVNSYSISDSFLKQIMVGYQIDMVESNGTLKFIPRGQSSSQTIDTDRLGAAVVTNQIGAQFPEQLARTYEASRLVPKQVKVIYLELNRDYDQIEQSLIRQDARNVDQVILDMSAFSWTDSIARRLADKTISIMFSEREQYVFFVSAYYFDIEPGDVVTITIDDEATLLRVTETTYNYPGIIQVQAVYENTEDYTSEIDGFGPATQALSFNYGGEHQPFVLDIPLLWDANFDDDVAATYVVFQTLGDEFPSSTRLLRSLENVFTWSTVSSTTSRAIVGVCENSTLASGTVDCIDRASTVTVRIPTSQSLSSITQAELLNGGNMCAIGSEENGYEILHFQNVTEIGSGQGTYQLDTFLRGKKGSDHLVGTHTNTDDFIMLTDATVMNVNDLAVGQMGITYDYTGIDIDAQIPENEDDIDYQRIEMSNNRVYPYSVAHPEATQDSGTKDITMTWVYRARIDQEWNDLYETPDSESSELYEVDILDGGSVVRTISGLTSPTATYTGAQQLTDFSSYLSSLEAKIYKLHPTFGRGTEKELNATF